MAEVWSWSDVMILRDSQEVTVLEDAVLKAEELDIEGEELRKETCDALITAALRLHRAKEPALPPPLVLTPATLVPKTPRTCVWAAIRRFCSMCEPAALPKLLFFLQSEDLSEIQVSCQGLSYILEVDPACPIPAQVRAEIELLSQRVWGDSPAEKALHGCIYVTARLMGFKDARRPKLLFVEQQKLLGFPINKPWEWSET